MRKNRYIFPLAKGLKKAEVGNKAQSLVFLKRHGFRIPETYILSAKAFDEYLKGNGTIPPGLRDEIMSLPEYSYAIRSSTSLEDSESHSYAGQFLTLTSVSGCDNILDAVQKVWRSAAPDTESGYFRKAADVSRKVRCSVIIQKMVAPVLAGVCFSKNPVTNLGESVIEAVEGKGEDLVQKGITPFRWRFLGRTELEGPAGFRETDIIRQLAAETIRLKKVCKQDVDLEWAYDGEHIYYLQVRGVQKSSRITVYSNRMVSEMLPGQIKPLVWDVNIPLVNSTFVQLVSEITGPLDLNPSDLTKAFCFRVYMNMAMMGILFRELGLPADTLESMLLSEKSAMPKFMPGLRTLRHIFRLVSFINSKLRFEKTFLKDYPVLGERYRQLKQKIDNARIIDEYQSLYNELFQEGKKLVYLNIVVPLLMQLYNKQLKTRLAKSGFDYDLLNFNEDFPELEQFSPLSGMNKLRRLYDEIPSSAKENCDTFNNLAGTPAAKEFTAEFEKFMLQFGHLSESGTDFSVRKWQEVPEEIFRMIIQSPPKTSNPDRVSFRTLPLKGIKYRRMKKLYLKAGRFRVYREQISSLYIFGYGLFRTLFLRLGKEFAEKGIISNPDDIFFLTRKEIEELTSGIRNGNWSDFSDIVAERKKEMDDSKDFSLPAVIYGEEAPIMEQGMIRNLKGVGTSSGSYHGKSRVVRDAADFNSVCEGDVLVIPFADVSWTPILVKAGAIVSESGGMLSHCSIIARELGIPSLVSVSNACSLLAGMVVTVDGSNGIVTVHDNE